MWVLIYTVCLKSNVTWFKRNHSQGTCSRRKNHKWAMLYRSDGMTVAKNLTGQTRFTWKQELVSVTWLCTCTHHVNCSKIYFIKRDFWDQPPSPFTDFTLADMFPFPKLKMKAKGNDLIPFKRPKECERPSHGDNLGKISRVLPAFTGRCDKCTGVLFWIIFIISYFSELSFFFKESLNNYLVDALCI
jgi:hypothetical protein